MTFSNVALTLISLVIALGVEHLFWTSAIGSAGPSWFVLAAVASAIAFYGHRFGLPEAVALRLVPSSRAARPVLFTQPGLLLLSLGGGIATQVGQLGTVGATIQVSLMALAQLSCAWFLFQWWRAAWYGDAAADAPLGRIVPWYRGWPIDPVVRLVEYGGRKVERTPAE